MAEQNLTTEEGMKDYLIANFNPSCHTVQRLPEGFGSFVYRVQLDPNNPQDPKSIIVKHVADYAARVPSWKLHQSRLSFEHKSLLHLSSTLPNQFSAVPIRVPHPLTFDPTSHVLVMEDLGPLPSLKHWLRPSSTPLSSAREVGSALGNFLAQLHDSTFGDEGVLAEFRGNECAKYLSPTLYFEGLPAAAEKFGYAGGDDDGRIEEAAEWGAKEVRECEEGLSLGDFWTGNVLISSSDGGSEMERGDGRGDGRREKMELFVLDLELCKPGPAWFDVGQMAAEMYCLAAFRDRARGEGLLEGFLRGYRENRKKGEIDVAGVAIRVGAHLVVMMPNAWRNEASPERIEEEVAVGVELLRMGVDRDMERLSHSIIRSLIS